MKYQHTNSEVADQILYEATVAAHRTATGAELEYDIAQALSRHRLAALAREGTARLDDLKGVADKAKLLADRRQAKAKIPAAELAQQNVGWLEVVLTTVEREHRAFVMERDTLQEAVDAGALQPDDVIPAQPMAVVVSDRLAVLRNEIARREITHAQATKRLASLTVRKAPSPPRSRAKK